MIELELKFSSPLPFQGNIVDIQAIMALKREKREGVTLNGLDGIQFNMALKHKLSVKIKLCSLDSIQFNMALKPTR